MSSYRIEGNRRISGKVRVSGNKNAALACLYATLLTDGKVVLSNIPEIEDVNVSLEILRCAGKNAFFCAKNTVTVEGSGLKNEIPRNLTSLVRGSILLAGAFAGRKENLLLPPPGGDVIGMRRLDSHFSALRSLGSECSVNADNSLVFINGSIKGCDLLMEEASVTGTENAVMAASLASGRTVIYNAACEPHVQDLCRMLVKMGAKIEGIGSNLLKIEGVEKLNGTEFKIGFDFMEAGSFFGLAAVTGGEVEIEGVDPNQFRIISSGFEKLGLRYVKSGPESILVPSEQDRVIKRSVDGRTIKIDDAPWPGFPTDLLSIIIVCATQMHGNVLVHEKMFESRLYFVDNLIRMGADIIHCDPHRILVTGPTPLIGTTMTSPDLRAGMAMVLAAMCANGTSEIQNIYQIERGYENLGGKLKALGAQIEVLD